MCLFSRVGAKSRVESLPSTVLALVVQLPTGTSLYHNARVVFHDGWFDYSVTDESK